MNPAHAAHAVDPAALARLRAHRPEAVAEAAARRVRRPLLGRDGRLLILAADHPARGALGAGSGDRAMADRAGLLARLRLGLSARASTASSPAPTSWTTSCCSGRWRAGPSWAR